MSVQTVDAKALKAERTKLFEDVYSGVIPKRVPIAAGLSLEACIQYAGLPLGETLWTLNGVSEALEKFCKMIPSDEIPAGGIPKNPAVFKFLDSKGYAMGSGGFMQHGDMVTLEASEYDEFIRNPYDFIIEKSLPRMFKALDTDPVTRSIVLSKAYKAFYDYNAAIGRITAPLIEKYGYFTPPAGSGTLCQAPFDFIGDFLRGFAGIYHDLRRCPEKIMEACEAVLPMQIKRGIAPKPSKLGHVFMPLHLATYMRTKDFEKVFWPYLSKYVHAMAEQGQTCMLFCEHDWTRYLDYLYELPENTRFKFEFGEPKLIKEKLGKKHIITGLYPTTLLKTATKQQAVDKAKELLDILAPGGRFIFGWDKTAVSIDSINLENYIAVVEYVAENGKYDNPGEIVKDTNANNDSKVDTDIPPFESKYYTAWNKENKTGIEAELENTINPALQSYEEMMFRMTFTIL